RARDAGRCLSRRLHPQAEGICSSRGDPRYAARRDDRRGRHRRRRHRRYRARKRLRCIRLERSSGEPMKYRALGTFTLVALLTAASGRADDVEQAKNYFNAGATAYAAGQFVAAAQAFDQAYKLAPRPAILFSMAQAERRQYVIDSRPE